MSVRFRDSEKQPGFSVGTYPSTAVFLRSGLFFMADNSLSGKMTDIALFVDSRDRNTSEIADAMAVELGISTKHLTALLPADAKVLFPGSGTYESTPGIEMIKFVTDNVFYGF